MQCPLCLRDTQRQLGGVILCTPDDLANPNSTPLIGSACNICLSIVAQTLDRWRNGGINNFTSKLKDAGLIRELTDFVSNGTFNVG